MLDGNRTSPMRQLAGEQLRINEKQLVEIGAAVAHEIDAQVLQSQLLQNSLPLLGRGVFLYAYARSQALYVAFPEGPSSGSTQPAPAPAPLPAATATVGRT